jgi:hypothetical protein
MSVLLGIILATGWIEDIAARRRPRLLRVGLFRDGTRSSARRAMVDG